MIAMNGAAIRKRRENLSGVGNVLFKMYYETRGDR